MNVLLLWIILGLAQFTEARELHLLVPQEVAMELHQIDRMNDPYLYPIDRELKYGGAFVTDFHLVEWENFSFYSNNRVSFEQSQVTGKVRHGGWNFQLGVEAEIGRNSAIQIGKYHYSYHIFEGERERHFPTFDSYYINLVIYKK